MCQSSISIPYFNLTQKGFWNRVDDLITERVESSKLGILHFRQRIVFQHIFILLLEFILKIAINQFDLVFDLIDLLIHIYYYLLHLSPANNELSQPSLSLPSSLQNQLSTPEISSLIEQIDQPWESSSGNQISSTLSKTAEKGYLSQTMEINRKGKRVVSQLWQLRTLRCCCQKRVSNMILSGFNTVCAQNRW